MASSSRNAGERSVWIRKVCFEYTRSKWTDVFEKILQAAHKKFPSASRKTLTDLDAAKLINSLD